MKRGHSKMVQQLGLVAVLVLVASGCPSRPDATTDPQNETPEAQQQRALERVQTTLDRDGRFLHEMQTNGTYPMFQQKFGRPFTGAGVLEWVSERVARVIYTDRPLTSGGPEAIAANVSSEGPEYRKNFLIGPSFFDESRFPQIARVSIFLHEARHSDGFDDMATENDSMPHERCPADFEAERMRGQYACDKNLDGSYAYQALFLREVMMHCSNCSRTVKRVAGEMFVDSLLRHYRAEDRMALMADLPRAP